MSDPKRGRSWYINKKGQRAFAGEFALASDFFKGLAHVKYPSGPGIEPFTADEQGEYAYIDRKGKAVFTYTP